MSDDKKYYYLKLKDNFFDPDAMIVLESMQDGYLYSNILLKLFLRSLKNEGKLMFNERIPYNSNILSQVVRHNVGVIEKAMKIFSDLELIEVLDNGAIYMLDIQNFIGSSSTEADRQRNYRNQLEIDRGLKHSLQMSHQMSHQTLHQMNDKSTPEIELKIKKELKKDLKKEVVQKTKKIYNECVEISDTEYQTLIERYGTEERLKKGIEILNNYLMTSGKKYKSHYHVLIGWVLERVNENEKSKGYGLPSNDGKNTRNETDEPKPRFKQIDYLSMSNLSG